MIGAGGMGEVYKGHEIQTGRAVAIKMLLPEMADNEAALALFLKEASALHNLTHEAIVRYFVYTVEPELQRPYLAMEFVDGRSLSDMIEEGPLTLEAVQRLLRRVASGLSAAHQRGIIHRDVSPDNIIVPQGDVARAKIIDFGIARSTQVGDATIIGSGFAGKHNYVSPEQIGLFGGDVTAKSDIYSLGLVLFQALTGQKLDMGGSQFQLVEKRRRVPDLGAVNARIRPLLERMLQPDPDDRPASMEEIANWNAGVPVPGTAAASQPAAPVTSHPLARHGLASESQPSAAAHALRWRMGAIAASALVVLISASAYYTYVWDVPVAVAPPPLAPLSQTPPPPRPAAPPDTPKDPPREPPASPANLPAEDLNRADVVRRFLTQYDGGDCFFIMPVAVSGSAAVVEGYGASTTPFDALDNSFKRSQGFEASIGVRLVTPPQCPAITFLNRFRAETTRAPRIALGSVKLRPGEQLAGTIENFANRVVELLMVTENGQVQNMSYLLKPGTDALAFTIDIPRTDDTTGGSAPQLIMAVTSPRVLDSLRQPRPTPADQFFLQAQSEAQRTNLSLNASARYVTIQK